MHRVNIIISHDILNVAAAVLTKDVYCKLDIAINECYLIKIVVVVTLPVAIGSFILFTPPFTSMIMTHIHENHNIMNKNR
jgi:hypothetical protein